MATKVDTVSDWVLKFREKIERNPPGMKDRPALPHSEADSDCKRCGGWGWVQSRQFGGNWFICQCVTATREQFISAQHKPDYSRMGLQEDELGKTWSAMRPDISDGMKALGAVRPAYEQGWGMVFLWGTWGQGKTILGKILTATALRDHKSAAYANVSTVLDDIRLSFDADHQSTELLRRVEWWISRDVLFLDELDKVNGTSWAESTIFTLLDRRYARAIREEALTVIASNKSNEGLDGYLKSRLNDRRLGPVVYLNGADGRAVMPDGYHF